jgi:hypothetical protein
MWRLNDAALAGAAQLYHWSQDYENMGFDLVSFYLFGYERFMCRHI